MKHGVELVYTKVINLFFEHFLCMAYLGTSGYVKIPTISFYMEYAKRSFLAAFALRDSATAKGAFCCHFLFISSYIFLLDRDGWLSASADCSKSFCSVLI